MQIASISSLEGDIVECPPTDGANAYYVNHRAPLLPNPLIKLPIGSITPRGWVRGQLELERDGMIGHLPELSHWCRPEGNSWMSADGAGHSPWEELPYWLKGFGDLGYVLKDERIIGEARKWIDALLAGQQPDGYFGPRENKKKRDVWPNMLMLNVLQSFYEATGDPRVLPAMTKYLRWQASLPPADLLPESWQKVRAGDNLESVHWLYNRTGEPWLLELGKSIHERTIRWDEKVANWHGVNICQGYREPAVYYVQSKDDKHLAAAERNYQAVMDLYGQVPGGMFGADENCRKGYDDPRQAAEACSMVEFMHSFQMLGTFTGDAKFFDRCEDVAFNSLPAAFTPDLKGLHYLTAPNMVQLDRENKSPGVENGGCMLAYSGDERYRCCQHNVAMGWPYYAEHLWMATRDNGLAAVLYAASEVRAKVGDGAEVTIAQATDYPFDENITLKVQTTKPVKFPLYLRIPRWSERTNVAINRNSVEVVAKPSQYVRIERTWADGDEVYLQFSMKIDVKVWEKNKRAVSVSRGPLTYSLQIGERWEKFGGSEKWPDYEVFPTTAWNYGLMLDKQNPAASFKTVMKTGLLPPQPFVGTGAVVELRANAKRIPQWKQDHMGLVGLLQESPVRSDAAMEEVTLIPMGCARLRISAFPVIGEGTNAHQWIEPPAPRHIASHYCDDVNAISDGKLPKDSGDHSIPRFTWWDHKGTVEWVNYAFDRPRKVASCAVYWFDDEPRGGGCRVPQSWRVLYRVGNEWRSVRGASGYGVEKDHFNKAIFEAVETTELRLEVTFRKGYSGGVLEWEIGK